MAKYVCRICGWEYDEDMGFTTEGIKPGTKWEDVPENFLCPVANCEAPKAAFKKVEE